MDVLIKSGKKAWIQTKKKDELIIIANTLVSEEDIQFTNNNSVEEIRRFLRDYIEEQEEYRDCTAEKHANYKMNLISNLEVFNGGNWNAYKQQLECFFILNDIDTGKKVPLLITKLGTSVYELLTTICTPESPVDLTYEQICEKLEKHYHPVRNYALEQAEFRKRKQKKDEFLDKYILELKKLSKNCNFKNLNEEIKERLLNGTLYEAVKFEMLKQADLPLEKLLEIGKTVETAYNLTYKSEEKETQPQMFKAERNRGYGLRHENTKLTPQAGGSAGVCFCCGKQGHMRAECTLRGKFCSECGMKGHIYKMCNRNEGNWRMKTLNMAEEVTTQNSAVNEEKYEQKNDTPGPELYDMFCFGEQERIPPAKLSVQVSGKLLEFEDDTGADVSTITCSDKEQHFPNLEIKHRNVIFTNFDQSTSTPLGALEDLSLSYGTVNVDKQILYIVKDELPRIIGKNWLSILKLWPLTFEQRKINETDPKETLESGIKSEFNTIFEPGMGDYKGEPIHLEIEPGDPRPICMPVRTVPFALKDKVKDEIEGLIKNKRIVPVEYADWGTPIVPVLKPDGSFRLCGDFRQYLFSPIHKVTGQSPAKVMFGRELSFRFSLLMLHPVAALIDNEHIKQSLKNSKDREIFLIGEKVARDYRKNKKKWSLGVTTHVIKPGVTYEVEGRSGGTKLETAH